MKATSVQATEDTGIESFDARFSANASIAIGDVELRVVPELAASLMQLPYDRFSSSQLVVVVNVGDMHERVSVTERRR